MGQAKVQSQDQWVWFDLREYWDKIENEAKRRWEQKRGQGSHNPWRGDKNPDIPGLAGEQAFECFTGLPVDWSLTKRGDGGWDFLLPCGMTVDVKGVTHPDPILKHPFGKPMNARIFVLAHWPEGERRAALVGETMAEVFANASASDFGYGRQHVMHWSELWAFSTPQKVLVT